MAFENKTNFNELVLPDCQKLNTVAVKFPENKLRPLQSIKEHNISKCFIASTRLIEPGQIAHTFNCHHIPHRKTLTNINNFKWSDLNYAFYLKQGWKSYRRFFKKTVKIFCSQVKTKNHAELKISWKHTCEKQFFSVDKKTVVDKFTKNVYFLIDF